MIDPYRLLFPLGLLFGFSGTAVWITFALQGTNYPAVVHADIMIGGFVFLYAIGFLMTALPRFTGTPSATKGELGTALAIGLGLHATSFMAERAYFHLLVFAGLMTFAVFGIKRFLNRTYNPPPHFIYVAFGLFSGIAGSSALAAYYLTGSQNSSFMVIGKLMLSQGMILSFVLGVGGKLIPMLMGHKPKQVTGPLEKTKYWRAQVLVPFALFVLSFIIEPHFHILIGRYLRAIVATYVAFSDLRALKFSNAKSRITLWVRTSLISIVVGLWICALFPTYGVHALHLVFISGFGLLTLTIASRVTLAHGGFDMSLEKSSKIMLWCGILLVLTSLTRVTAPLVGNYVHHLGFAAGLWIIALILWAILFLPKILQVSKEH